MQAFWSHKIEDEDSSTSVKRVEGVESLSLTGVIVEIGKAFVTRLSVSVSGAEEDMIEMEVGEVVCVEWLKDGEGLRSKNSDLYIVMSAFPRSTSEVEFPTVLSPSDCHSLVHIHNITRHVRRRTLQIACLTSIAWEIGNK